jgi:hypothetical protein
MTHHDGRTDYQDKKFGGRTGCPVGSSGGDSYLLGEDLRLEVSQRQLEPPVAVIVEDLHGNQVFWACMRGDGWCRHSVGRLGQQYVDVGEIGKL